ncbi:kinase-like domain-containing protein [Aspergillus pseudonomiae]|nr:kinase-like domain-containing protein [Aspergillus pseudonomiae]
MYRHMEEASTNHPGRDVIKTLLDTFYIDGPQDKHRCLVHPPLWKSVLAFLRRNPVERLPSAVIAVVLHRLFLALDYLHTECQIAHTDMKADNIMFGSLFTGQDPTFERYRSRAHLAELINLLGPPPSSLLAQAELRDKFFSSDGAFLTPDLLTDPGKLEREMFLHFMRKMLQWEPSKRSSAKELAEDEWIHSHM